MNFALFQKESNFIERIAEVTDEQVAALVELVQAERLTVEKLVAYVNVCQPDALLRDNRDVPCVCVGNHVAPASDPDVVLELQAILARCNALSISAFEAHVRYEYLHPFTDGNGRSGRALWLWVMLRGTEEDKQAAESLGFLHTFYYQTLENSYCPSLREEEYLSVKKTIEQA